MKAIVLMMLVSGLVAMGVSCKKPRVEPIPIDPDEAVGEPPLPPEGCKIVKEYYKTLYVPQHTWDNPVGVETVTLPDGKQVKVYLVSITTYFYDKQNRVTGWLRESGKPDVYTAKTIYTYEPTRVLIAEEYREKGKLIVVNRDTLRLNDRGLFTVVDEQGKPTFIYNEHNQPLASSAQQPYYSYTYKDGNVVEYKRFQNWVQRQGGWMLTQYESVEYEYDLKRPALPVINQVFGTRSRNLLTKETWLMYGHSDFANGPVHQKVYKYTYDKLGRVKRQIVQETDPWKTGYLVGDNPYGIGVRDYEYECP